MTEHYLDRLARTINENWDQPALTDFYLTEDGSAQDTSRGNHYTYGEMYAELCHVAELLTSIGLQKGDHIAICGANSAHWCIAYLAIAKMQGVSVTVMHSLQPDKIAHLVDFSDAKALFVDIEVWDELQSQPLPQIRYVIDLEGWNVLRGENIEIPNREALIENHEVRFDHGDPNELAQICFTSGSTGKPKGVMIAMRAHSLGGDILQKLFSIPECNKNVLTILPYGHIFGLGDVNSALYFGNHVFIAKDAFGLQSFMRVMALIKPYRMMMAPQMLKGITTFASGTIIKQCCDYLKYVIIGGAVLSDQSTGELQKSKLPITIGYGATELTPMISLSPVVEYKKGSCGKVSDCCRVLIADTGEILVKGENVMLGYYKDPEATARKIDSDGWLHTGDKGHLDEDGYLYVEGRLEQDIIVLPNGENIRPDHIESLINALPEVSESIVLARDGHLIAIVFPKDLLVFKDPKDFRRTILRTINPQLPLYSQIYDVEITDVPLTKTEKQTIKRYLYK